MARKHLITHIRSAVPGKTPVTSSLELGEFAINTHDGKVFIRRSGSFGDEVVQVVTTEAKNTGSVDISGSLLITGSIYLSTASIDEGLSDFIVWDSGSGQFKRRTSGADGTSGTSGTDGLPGNDGTSGTSGTSGLDAATNTWTGSDADQAVWLATGSYNVGIGYSGSQIGAKLHVSGNISASGYYYGDGRYLTNVTASFVPANLKGYWTASDSGSISRDSQVQISGSLTMSGSIILNDGDLVDGFDVSRVGVSQSVYLTTPFVSDAEFTTSITWQELSPSVTNGLRAASFNNGNTLAMYYSSGLTANTGYYSVYDITGSLVTSSVVYAVGNATVPLESYARHISGGLYDDHVAILYALRDSNNYYSSSYQIIDNTGSVVLAETKLTASTINAVYRDHNIIPVRNNNTFFYVVTGQSGNRANRASLHDRATGTEITGTIFQTGQNDDYTLAAFDNGNTFVCQTDWNYDGYIYYWIFDNSGSIVKDKTRLDSTEWNQVDAEAYNAGYQDYPAAVTLPNGNVMIVYDHEYAYSGWNVCDLKFGIVDSSGNILVSGSKITNAKTESYLMMDTDTGLTLLNNGDLLVLFRDSNGNNRSEGLIINQKGEPIKRLGLLHPEFDYQSAYDRFNVLPGNSLSYTWAYLAAGDTRGAYKFFDLYRTFHTTNYERIGIGTSTPASASLHVWGDISASNFYWNSTDLTSFSSSIGTQISNLGTGSALWTLLDDSSIRRISDVRITGSLYVSESIHDAIYGKNAKIGIGNRNPLAKLHVSGTMIVESGSDTPTRLSIQHTSASMEISYYNRDNFSWAHGIDVNDGAKFKFGHTYGNPGEGSAEADITDNTVMTFTTQSNRIGIGTNEPQSALHVWTNISASNLLGTNLTVTSNISGSNLYVQNSASIHAGLLVYGDATVYGVLTADEVRTTYVSSSIIYASGSTKFGDTTDDIHSFTGSIQQSGSRSYFLSGVGIGTSTPYQSGSGYLHVWNDISASLMTAESGTFTHVSSSFVLGTSASLEHITSSHIEATSASFQHLEVDDQIFLIDTIVAATGAFAGYTEFGSDMYVSGNIVMSASSTVDGIDLSVFSSSVATELVNLTGSISYLSSSITDRIATVSSSLSNELYAHSGSYWTGSEGRITRYSQVDITGSLRVRPTSGSATFLIIDTIGASEYVRLHAGGVSDVLYIDDTQTKDFYPQANLTYDLGTSSRKYTNIWGGTITGSRIESSGDITGSALYLGGRASFESEYVFIGNESSIFTFANQLNNGDLSLSVYSVAKGTTTILMDGSAGNIVFRTDTGNERVRITHSGSIGIGTDATDVDGAGNLQASGTVSASALDSAGTLVVDGTSTFNDDVTVNGILYATEFQTTFISSSIIYSSGSTKFGDSLDDIHSFTGSVYISNSLDVTGDITADNFIGTSSYATSASRALSASIADFYPYAVTDFGAITKDPTGFKPADRDNCQISHSNGTRTFYVYPKDGTSFSYYIYGQEYVISATHSVVHGHTVGEHHFYFDNTSTLQTTDTFDLATLLEDNAYVANLYWATSSAEALFVGGERHGLSMDYSTHEYLHTIFGTQWISGLGINILSIDGNGNVSESAQLGVTNGVIADEDIRHTITTGDLQTLNPTGSIPIFYKTGSGIWAKKSAGPFPIIHRNSDVSYVNANGRVPYNLNTGGDWTLQEVSNNSFVLVHYFATNDINYNKVIGIQGEAEYGNIGTARAAAGTEIADIVTNGIPVQEFKTLGTVIFQTSNTYNNAPRVRIVSTGDGDYVDFRTSAPIGTGGSSNDHGSLSGLADDDHIQYVLVDGTRDFEGTASFADSASSALYAVSASYASNGLWSALDDGSIQRISDVRITGSLNVQGSTKLGDSAANTHIFTGSVYMSTSLDVDGTGSFGEIWVPEGGKIRLDGAAGGEYFYAQGASIRGTVGGGTQFLVDGDGVTTGTGNQATLYDLNPSDTIPGHNFRGDLDTGMGRAGANTGSLIAGGTNVMNWFTDGTVGIGTLRPHATLHLQGTDKSGSLYITNATRLTGIILKGTPTNNSPGILFDGTYLTGGGTKWNIWHTTGGDGPGIGHLAVLEGSNSYRFIIRSGGNVGIGTIAPAVTGLHVWNDVSASNFYGDGSGLTNLNVTGSTSASYASFATSASYAEFGTTASYAEFATSASFAITASYATSIAPGLGGYWTSSADGSINRNSDVKVTGSLTVTGVITAQEFNTEYFSSSIIYSSGSTKFGDDAGDIHSFTGSIRQSGSDSYFMNNIGIGTTAPATTGFHVWSNVSASAFYGDGSNLTGLTIPVGSGSFWTGSQIGYIERSGRVQVTGSFDVSETSYAQTNFILGNAGITGSLNTNSKKSLLLYGRDRNYVPLFSPFYSTQITSSILMFDAGADFNHSAPSAGALSASNIQASIIQQYGTATLDEVAYSWVGGYRNSGNRLKSALVVGNANEFHNIPASANDTIWIGGYGNKVYNTYGQFILSDTSISSGSSDGGIFGGYNHLLNDDYTSVIVGGDTNQISGSSDYSFIAGGEQNKIGGGSQNNSVIASYGAQIDGGAYGSAIIGGISNIMAGGIDGVILGGQNNYVTDDYPDTFLIVGKYIQIGSSTGNTFVIGAGEASDNKLTNNNDDSIWLGFQDAVSNRHGLFIENAGLKSEFTSSVNISGALNVHGDVSASTYYGDGSNLTNLPSQGYWTASNGELHYLGNVGVGTNDPEVQFHSNGSILSTGIGAPSSATGIRVGYDSGIPAGDIAVYDWGGSAWVDLDIRAKAIDLKVDGTTTIYATSSTNYVGIGTDAPQIRLHAWDGSAGGYPTWAGADVLLVENDSSNNTAIQILSADNLDGIVAFSDTSDRAQGIIRYSHTEDIMSFGADATAIMYISGTGEVGIGTATPAQDLHIYNAGGAVIRLHNDDFTDISKIEFYSNNNIYHTIQSTAQTGEFQIRAGDAGSGHKVAIYSDNTKISEFRKAQIWISASVVSASSLEVEGQVGIGTGRLSGYDLHVWGDVSASNFVGTSSHATYAVTASYSLGSVTDPNVSVSASIWQKSGSVVWVNSGSLMDVGIGVSGSDVDAKLHVYSTNTGSRVFLVEGQNGALFQVIDELSGSLFAVSDISGLPILEVFDDDRVVAGKFNSNALVVTGSQVGVGTAAPAVATKSLHVWNELSASVYYGSGAGLTNLPAGSGGYWTGSGATIYRSSNVGVGVIPQYTFHVLAGSGQTALNNWDASFVAIENDTDTNNNTARIRFQNSNDTAQAQVGAQFPDAAAALGSRIFFNTMTTGGSAQTVMIIDENARVGIGTTTPQVTLDVVGDAYVSGTLSAHAKSFDIPHPTKEGMRLKYGTLEGPEYGVYYRGKKKGSYIKLPEYWSELVDENSITVQLTPIGKHQKLYVSTVNAKMIVIGNEDGITPHYFYTVYAERKDIDKLNTEYYK